jgi:hypothetical protein
VGNTSEAVREAVGQAVREATEGVVGQVMGTSFVELA